MLMGKVHDFVEFVLYSVSCYQLLTLGDPVRAVYEVIFRAITFEPKTE